MTLTISTTAPALGDIRSLGRGDAVVVYRAATERRDWARYWEAVGVAVSRGAVLRMEES